MPLGIRIHDVRGRHPPKPIALIVADRLRPGADSAGRVPGSRPPAGTVRRDRGRELSRGRRTCAEGAAARGASWKRDENVIIHRGEVPSARAPGM